MGLVPGHRNKANMPKKKSESCELFGFLVHVKSFPVAQQVKICLPKQETQETWVQSLGQEDPREEGMATHSKIIVWRIPWTVEPGRLQSAGSHRVGHD